MKRNFPNTIPTALCTAVALMGAVPSAVAGEGHDHGEAAPALSGPALPRFAAVSEAFELVGVLNGKQLTLYLDRFDTNAPVRDAQIELEIAGAKFKAEKHGDAEYEVVFKEELKPGVLPVTATVSAGSEVDLLAGEIDLHEQAHAHEPAPISSWKAYASWAAVGLIALAVLVFGGRRVMASRRLRVGGVA